MSNKSISAPVFRGDIYPQLPEGPKAAVKATHARIKRDDRHLEVMLHVSEPVAPRMFADRAMPHDPARSWQWRRDEIARLLHGTRAEADG